MNQKDATSDENRSKNKRDKKLVPWPVIIFAMHFADTSFVIHSSLIQLDDANKNRSWRLLKLSLIFVNFIFRIHTATTNILLCASFWTSRRVAKHFLKLIWMFVQLIRRNRSRFTFWNNFPEMKQFAWWVVIEISVRCRRWLHELKNCCDQYEDDYRSYWSKNVALTVRILLHTIRLKIKWPESNPLTVKQVFWAVDTAAVLCETVRCFLHFSSF